MFLPVLCTPPLTITCKLNNFLFQAGNKNLNNAAIGTSEWDVSVPDLIVFLGTNVEGSESFVLGKASESSELNDLLGELVLWEC